MGLVYEQFHQLNLKPSGYYGTIFKKTPNTDPNQQKNGFNQKN